MKRSTLNIVILINSLFCIVAGAKPLPTVQNRQCLTPDTNGRLPAFLPNGKDVVYVQDTPKGQQVAVVNIDTRKIRLVSEPCDVQTLSVSPDGKWIAITNGLAFARTIELMSLKDGRRKKLADGPGFRSAPMWINDGKLLLFSRKLKGKTKWIKMNPFTDPPTKEEITPLGTGEPTVSPKGNRIALVTRNDRGEALLKIIGRDGKMIADIPPMQSNSATPVRGCYDPTFSSDETLLAYVRSDLQPMSDIILRDLKTGKEIPVTSDRTNNQSPAFSPDGSLVVYSSQKEGNLQRLWMVRLESGGETHQAKTQ